MRSGQELSQANRSLSDFIFVSERRLSGRMGGFVDVIELLAFAHQQKASDLHLSAGLAPLIRVDGDIKTSDFPPLTSETLRSALYKIMKENQIKQFEETQELDFSFEVPNLSRFRANIFQQNRGIAAAFRLIPNKILTLEELNAPSVLKEIADNARGIVLVTGPTGSGKSTSLAAMIDYINTRKNLHIVTIEDPIEFIHGCKKSLIHQREVHRDTFSFKAALRSALREDPDVILVGELRDLETIRLALTAAETGHLVFATVHTSSAAKTIDRIIDVFPGEEKAMVRGMLSEGLRAVISQTLLKKVGSGRLGAFEVMLCTPAIRNLIRESKTAQMYSVIQTGRSMGMQTLDQHLQELVQGNLVHRKDAQQLSENKALFE